MILCILDANNKIIFYYNMTLLHVATLKWPYVLYVETVKEFYITAWLCRVLSFVSLCLSQLEVANMSMEKKITEMEEKVQALTAQLMVYKEDFDLERQDRERAQGKLIEFEQQLLFYQVRRYSRC